MGLADKSKSFFNKEVTLTRLLKAVLILLIIFLLSQTWSVWQSLLKYLFKIFKPFIIGFTIAYVVSPLVTFLEKKGLKKGLAIALILLIGISLFAWLIISILPLIYDESGSFFNSISGSIDSLFMWYQDNANNPSEVIEGIIQQVSQSLAGLQKSFFDSAGVFVTGFISGSINVFTTLLFSLAVAIYTLADYDKVKSSINKVGSLINKDIPIYLAAIDEKISVYVKSTLILMVIYFFEYTLAFYLLGHKGFLIIGILYVLATLVPYIGGMVVTAIGILTGLTMPRNNLIALIVIIGIMSQIDGYFISPYVYKKGVKIEPLWSLLVVFIGSAILGPVGIMIAVPFYITIREIIRVYKDRNFVESKELLNEESI